MADILCRSEPTYEGLKAYVVCQVLVHDHGSEPTYEGLKAARAGRFRRSCLQFGAYL